MMLIMYLCVAVCFSRVLVFTQMARVLDVLEIFLNYHGHTYLRLDGATPVQKRQVKCKHACICTPVGACTQKRTRAHDQNSTHSIPNFASLFS